MTDLFDFDHPRQPETRWVLEEGDEVLLYPGHAINGHHVLPDERGLYDVRGGRLVRRTDGATLP